MVVKKTNRNDVNGRPIGQYRKPRLLSVSADANIHRNLHIPVGFRCVCPSRGGDVQSVGIQRSTQTQHNVPVTNGNAAMKLAGIGWNFAQFLIHFFDEIVANFGLNFAQFWTEFLLNFAQFLIHFL